MALTKTDIRPDPDFGQRTSLAFDRRMAAAGLAKARPQRLVASNAEELRFPLAQPSSFTKGLQHDSTGLVQRDAYEAYVKAMNSAGVLPSPDLVGVPIVAGARPWVSPLAGHAFDVEGPDAGAEAMPPAPRLGRSELCAEMATLYAMALVRDVPFADLAKGATVLPSLTWPAGHPQEGTPVTVQDLVNELRKLSWYDPSKPTWGTLSTGPTPHEGLTAHEQRRRAALWSSQADGLTVESLFRGASSGSKVGPMLSQFMLLGGTGRDKGNPRPRSDGKIDFGTQIIDQRTVFNTPGKDYMQSWQDWLDVQNGDASRPGTDQWEIGTRFITTPRDLATYVHFDALYQAYFNACLLMLESGVAVDSGLPDAGRKERSAGFATWGGPHILSLVTEVASRALRAVWRQKVMIHRRARPEVIAARLTQVANARPGAMDAAAVDAIGDMLRELGHDNPADMSRPGALLHWVAEVNRAASPMPETADVPIDPGKNYLLPQAFPEGSPMHPAYGAGHATVAGACVTILKAFFESDTSFAAAFRESQFHHADQGGTTLVAAGPLGATTLAQELDKLAANIAIGRNMAGVHYFSDYYDSLRLGERVAIGILEEQMLSYSEKASMSLTGFDGEKIRISTSGGPAQGNVTVSITAFPSRPGESVSDYHDWRLRDLVAYELAELTA